MFGPEAAGHATLEEAEADWQRMKMHERQRENGAAAGAGVAADAISAGLEVSFPWAQRLLDGDKTIETREYALPAHWEHKPMALIESNTPASVGEGGFEGGDSVVASSSPAHDDEVISVDQDPSVPYSF